ncbi:N-acetyl-gamma-glutamyl-phosphate reductase [Solwaraspora sp. WMMD791]|uniref:N-acetyl-gamma-glutamyl-phosphate reductase n=1 Tax=Solwaraspora sp. WMMD791 TaxID=3016086 RepID=UPI00249C5F26|nr:N-acetyl-gamma-glutamyl-phosphate reductase [Solwaraspora sp. WMMD791]WFE28803.1 N-acetyl-gamma-glutamyl-phosphate reductase [Solwaraspora sp. WMMD791]
MGIRVAVAGASGYAGGELLRLIAGHPELDLVAATAHSQAGAPVAAVHPHLVGLDLTFAGTDAASFADADLVFLALPHGESAAIAATLPAGVKVVDLGADHRLTDSAAWDRYYGGRHAGSWTYGLPELPGQRERIAAADRVAATGCYAVAITLALAPLIAAGAVDPADVVVVAASGTSGAGRAAKTHLLASEVMGSLSPYKVGAHQHVPEIKQATGATSLSFTPVLAPMPRGILATVTARPAGGAGTAADPAAADPAAADPAAADPAAADPAAAARAALTAAYADEPFVHLLPAGSWPATAATLGSNACHLQVTTDVDSGRVIVTSAIDNLGKGAAGQAVQCANLMLGLPETTGLTAFGVAP